jgi:hypothetical protein
MMPDMHGSRLCVQGDERLELEIGSVALRMLQSYHSLVIQTPGIAVLLSMLGEGSGSFLPQTQAANMFEYACRNMDMLARTQADLREWLYAVHLYQTKLDYTWWHDMLPGFSRLLQVFCIVEAAAHRTAGCRGAIRHSQLTLECLSLLDTVHRLIHETERAERTRAVLIEKHRPRLRVLQTLVEDETPTRAGEKKRVHSRPYDGETARPAKRRTRHGAAHTLGDGHSKKKTSRKQDAQGEDSPRRDTCQMQHSRWKQDACQEQSTHRQQTAEQDTDDGCGVAQSQSSGDAEEAYSGEEDTDKGCSVAQSQIGGDAEEAYSGEEDTDKGCGVAQSQSSGDAEEAYSGEEDTDKGCSVAQSQISGDVEEAYSGEEDTDKGCSVAQSQISGDVEEAYSGEEVYFTVQ